MTEINPLRNKRCDGEPMFLRGDAETLQRGSLHTDSSSSWKINCTCDSRNSAEKNGYPKFEPNYLLIQLKLQK